MYFDRFDILEAYYLFGSLYHGGQFTKEYAYMGRALNCGFKPSPLLCAKSLTDNGRDIFCKLVSEWARSNKFKIGDYYEKKNLD